VFEVKNKCRSMEEAKAEIYWSYFVFFLEDNKTHLAHETNSTKLK